MDGAEVGAGSIIGANALLIKETRIPPGSLVLGSPAKVVRSLTVGEQKGIEELAAKYVSVRGYYLASQCKIVVGRQPQRSNRRQSRIVDRLQPIKFKA